MPLKKGVSQNTVDTNLGERARSYKNTGKASKMAKGGDVIRQAKGVQGPSMIVKKRDGNRPVKIY
jgi:hypothetical protein